MLRDLSLILCVWMALALVASVANCQVIQPLPCISLEDPNTRMRCIDMFWEQMRAEAAQRERLAARGIVVDHSDKVRRLINSLTSYYRKLNGCPAEGTFSDRDCNPNKPGAGPDSKLLREALDQAKKLFGDDVKPRPIPARS
jgi:hypothetical protein